MEELINQFVNAVAEHYPNADVRPLLLSSFGQQHPELLQELKDTFGSLKLAVKAAGEDRVRFVNETRGSEAVAPANLATQVMQRLEQNTVSKKSDAINFESLPHSVQLAFVTRTDPGEQIAIDTTRPFRYSRVTDAALIAPSQRIIPDQYRRPGVSFRNVGLDDRATLWKNFLLWADAAGVNPKTFQVVGTTALSRLIAAQPKDIISQIVIPADIAQLLMKHS